MKEVRGKLMALMKKHQMDTTEFSEKCGIKEERVERLLGGRVREVQTDGIEKVIAERLQ